MTRPIKAKNRGFYRGLRGLLSIFSTGSLKYGSTQVIDFVSYF